MPTDTSEKGLEGLIVAALTGPPAPAPAEAGDNRAAAYGGGGYVLGSPKDYAREHCVDLSKLLAFLRNTQLPAFQQLGLDGDGPKRKQFLDRLEGEINKRGVIDVLRKGIDHGPAHVTLFYGSPSPGNSKALLLFSHNTFSVTRQLRYSQAEEALALDLVLFINGLPLATFELKNRLTKQTVHDAVEQYKRDRDPREPLFRFGRCLVHFAVDDQEVRFCTHLQGKDSWFLPFNQGHNDGAGNPPNEHGLKTDYLWRQVLTPKSLTDIIENYAQVVKDDQTGRKARLQIFPRYHQLDVVRKLLKDVRDHGVGRRYLIQHSAGSGKSNSIAWLAHQLVDLAHEGTPLLDSVIVVTDRKVLDRQIRDTIQQFAQVAATVGHADHAGDLRKFLTAGKKIIITTVQKFPVVLEEIGDDHRGRRFAILIDEAHSSQGGRTATKMNMVLAPDTAPDTGAAENDLEDEINRLMEARKMLKNASYFAFTATPKHKTLEVFGEPWPQGVKVKHRPFHSYTMKQAIQEGFILDVLQNYTPVQSYYRLAKKVADDPEYDSKKAEKKLRKFVESDRHAIEQKTEIMVDHFHEHVLAKKRIDGQARAMVITSGVERAIQYFYAFRDYLKASKSPYQAIVAFSGEHEYGGDKLTEATLNGFASHLIPVRIQKDPYRFLICAEKFQTGYDEPLLHTMYVDKPLAGIKAVQTLSRLNRAHPKKSDTFVLDFHNDASTIQDAFADYYRTTILSGETDPNKLHDLKRDLDAAQVYDGAQVDEFVRRYLGGADREQLDPILDACVGLYLDSLDEDGQVDFKGKAKAFVRTYGFLSAVLPFNNAAWEKLATFLNFLILKLPAPREEDLSKGILEAIDMDSYRIEVKAALSISLPDRLGEIDPMPQSAGGGRPEPQMARLSEILRVFNDLFGNIPWHDTDKVARMIAEEIPAKVAADQAYQNAMKYSDKQNARIEHDNALRRVLKELRTDPAELYKQFSRDEGFKKWLKDEIFAATYVPPPSSSAE